ncbi:hypothetical protein QWJ07_11855 [Frankia sp. RB7]|nr:hypothetical protein [Frankia sp. RB7]
MRPIIVAFATVAAYLPIAWYLDATYKQSPDPDVLRGPFTQIGSHAYVTYRKIAGAKGDTSTEPRRATLELTENGKALGPAHVLRSLVDTLGGSYIFLQTGADPPVLIFSTSDNSDPNTNGRVYRATDPDARAPYEAQRRR